MQNTPSAHQGRVLEIELMKAMAIVSMVFVHVFEMGIRPEGMSAVDGAIPYLIEFFGGFPGAGVFMFTMGWGAAHSKHATVDNYLKRGALSDEKQKNPCGSSRMLLGGDRGQRAGHRCWIVL